MNFASKNCWKPSKKSSSQSRDEILRQGNKRPLFAGDDDVEVSAVDTNVLAIGMEKLREWEENIEKSKPIECISCGGIFSKNVKFLVDKKQDVIVEDKNEELEESKEVEKEIPQKKVIEGSSNQWECNFCGAANHFPEGYVMPKNDEAVYLLERVKEHKETRAAGSVVFVVDVSGSMAVTAPSAKQGQNSQLVSNEEFESLREFMDPEDVAEYERQRKQTNNLISRRQCVVEAIRQQVDNLSQTQPEREVGVITFGSSVSVYGDGSAEPLKIVGDALHNCDVLFACAAASSENLLKNKVLAAKEKLYSILEGIKEDGQTALGPAIIAALGLLSQSSQRKGASIILCTDGMANIGVGAFGDSKDQSESTAQFYEQVKKQLKDMDIVLSVVTLKGEGCKMDVLGGLADASGGCVFRVDPSRVEQDFANILGDEVVALKAEMKVYLQRSMKFRSVDATVDKLSRGESTCAKIIGTATKKTSFTFEYTHKTDAEMIEQFGSDADKAESEDDKWISFQAQIKYVNQLGDMLLCVISKKQEITREKKVALLNSNETVINQRVSQHTAQLIQHNDFKKAKQFNKQWENYIVGSEEIQEESRQKFYSRNVNLKSNARQVQTVSRKKCNVPQTAPMLFANEKAIQQQPQVISAPGQCFLQEKEEKKLAILKKEEEEELFSGEEDEGADEDDNQAYFYQLKNNQE